LTAEFLGDNGWHSQPKHKTSSEINPSIRVFSPMKKKKKGPSQEKKGQELCESKGNHKWKNGPYFDWYKGSEGKKE